MNHMDRAEAQQKFQEIRDAFEQLTSCCRVEGSALGPKAEPDGREVFLTVEYGWTPGKETQVRMADSTFRFVLPPGMKPGQPLCVELGRSKRRRTPDTRASVN